MIIAILQARYSSTRLPGKVLQPILGKPMLARQIERILRSNSIDKLVVATSSDVSDDPIVALCRELDVFCYRGSLNDVLDRFYQTALLYHPQHVVRLTGDCPLYDPNLGDQIIQYHVTGGFDYTSNTIKPTFPDGLDVEVFRYSCLQEAWREAVLPSQREHVTPFIYQQPERFCLGNYLKDVDLSELRWTVDEGKDFDLIKTIYESLYPTNPCFTTEEILKLLETRPELKTYNASFKRNEGYLKSLKEEEILLERRKENV